jgi:DNA recombination protein RmuC
MTLGRDLYDRLGTLGSHTMRMGTALQRSVEAYNQMVGALESRVLVSARRMHEAGIVERPLPTPLPLETGPRVLTAMELIEAATADAERPQLDFDDVEIPPRWTGRESTA